jgi:pilus assembly protein CpaF
VPESEISLSDRLGNELRLPLSAVLEGAWLSVGDSPLCDIPCSFLAPDENIQLARYGDFVAIRIGQQENLGFLRAECQTRRIRVCVQVLREEPVCLRKYVLAFFPSFSHVFLQMSYEQLKNRVLSQFDSQLLVRPLSSNLLTELSARVSAFATDEIVEFALISMALFTDVFLEGSVSGLLSDPEISEVVCNGDDSIWIEKDGSWSKLPLPFSSWDGFERWLLYQSSRANAELYTERHFSDFVLRCGARVHVSFPPIARSRAYVTIRSHKASDRMLSVRDFVFANDGHIQLLLRAVDDRRNILIIGPTGSGKTTLLRFLLERGEELERILVLEDTPELYIKRQHVVYLQTRDRMSEHAAAVNLSDLVREALRMRPDRIVVGECRGPEAFALLQALHTGHRGTLCTLHAATVEDALDRFQTLVMQAQPSLSAEVVRRMIHTALDVVVVLARHADGSRCVVEARELSGV